jgi:hypothetical protein
MKDHSAASLQLTVRPERATGQGVVGSLTGAVASQRVTEAPKGSLRLGGYQPCECNGTRELDCEADTPNRHESGA